MCGHIQILEDMKEGAEMVRFADNLFFVWFGEEKINVYSEGGQLMDGVSIENKDDITDQTVEDEIESYLEKREEAAQI